MTLLGESQEEDRKLMTEMVLSKMEQFCRPVQSSIRYIFSRKVYILLFYAKTQDECCNQSLHICSPQLGLCKL